MPAAPANIPASRWDFTDKKGNVCAPPAPLAPLADTHGHLTHFRRTTAADAIVRAALAGVRLLVVPVDPVDEVGPGLRFESPAAFCAWLDEQVEQASAALGELAAQGVEPPAFAGDPGLPSLTDNVRIVAGAHPYGAADLDGAALARLDELLASPRCVGVGEIGIDVGPYAKLPVDVQEQAFRAQLRVAAERGLPVELHLRDEEDGVHVTGHDVALRVLWDEGVPAAGCDLHCFTAGPEVMAPFVELGCRIAFGGAATFARSEAIRAAALACPSHLLLSETDSPYMAPVPLRGRECEPGMVAFTAALLADVRAEADVAAGAVGAAEADITSEAVGAPEADVPAATADVRVATYRQLWDNARAFFGV